MSIHSVTHTLDITTMITLIHNLAIAVGIIQMLMYIFTQKVIA